MYSERRVCGLVKGVNKVARIWDMIASKNTVTKAGIGLAASCLASQVFASAFQLNEQNVTNLGLAYSGTAALAEDVSTNFYNPAGLVYLGESQVVLAGMLIHGNFDFDATTALSSTGAEVAGSRSDDPGTVVGVGAFHIAKRLDGRWVFGLSVTSPFGLLTEYSDTGIARYTATKSSLETLDFGPSLAWQALPTVALGAGGDALYGKARLRSNVGSGAAGVSDGELHNIADGWGFGWHAGILWEPMDTTRIGLNYRSRISLRVEGQAKIVTPGTGVVALPDVHSHVPLPATLTFSAYQEVLPCLALTADVAWTQWSKFEFLELGYHPAVPGFASDLYIEEQFSNTMRYALGAIYSWKPQWSFRVGIAWDESPVSDQYRTAAIPDADRFWLSVGAAYTLSEKWRFDIGYAHLFFDDATIDQLAPINMGTLARASASRLTGNFDSGANILGIQLRYDFV